MANYRISMQPDWGTNKLEGRNGLDRDPSAVYASTFLGDETFVRRTISAMKGKPDSEYNGRIHSIDFVFCQYGEVNTIWKANANTQDGMSRFILVLSRGNDYNGSTEADYGALSLVTRRTKEEGLEDICARPYILSQESGKSGTLKGFSVQRLYKEEVNSLFFPYVIMTFNVDKVGYAPIGFMSYIFNSTAKEATAFNEQYFQPAKVDDITQELLLNIALRMVKGHRKNLGDGDLEDALSEIGTKKHLPGMRNLVQQTLADMMTGQMVEVLKTLHLLTGGVPRGFYVSSGDFVGNPSLTGDYRLQLITIGDGLMQVSDKDFLAWLSTRKGHTQYSPMNSQMYASAPDFPRQLQPSMQLFSTDTKIVKNAIAAAEMKMNKLHSK